VRKLAFATILTTAPPPLGFAENDPRDTGCEEWQRDDGNHTVCVDDPVVFGMVRCRGLFRRVRRARYWYVKNTDHSRPTLEMIPPLTGVSIEGWREPSVSHPVLATMSGTRATLSMTFSTVPQG
jgi:hypothetical protein